MDRTNQQKEKSLREGTRIRDPIVNTLRKTKKKKKKKKEEKKIKRKKQKTTEPEAIIYTQKAWCSPMQTPCMLL